MNFVKIAEHASDNWRGKFSRREIAEYATELENEWKRSMKVGEVSEAIQQLIRNLAEDGGEIVAEWLEEFFWEMPDRIMFCKCEKCGKMEVAFFTEKEHELLVRKADGEPLLIQDVLPNHSSMVREVFVSGRCICPKCWADLF